MIMKRVLFDLVLLATLFYLPWWCLFTFVAIGVYLFPFYGEAIVFGFLLDLLYGTNILYGFGIIGLVSSLGIFLIVLRIKKAIRN